MKYLKELTFKVGDLLVLDESYVEKTGIRNLAWLVLKTTPTGFYFLDIGGCLLLPNGIQPGELFKES